MTVQSIPFHIEVSRVIDLLAKQIYQSPLALLRENAQNAYDAVLMRRQDQPEHQGSIQITISPTEIIVSDDGIGMTLEQLKSNFWRAGKSGKNNAKARAAGVVGTFGIGAMANFGIASELLVETESAETGERFRSRAARDNLSATENCIDIESLPSCQAPGTSVTARIPDGERVNVAEATHYISEFVAFLRVPVAVNGTVVSGKSVETLVPRPPAAWAVKEAAARLGSHLVADIELVVSSNADVWLRLGSIQWQGNAVSGDIVLKSGVPAIRTFRSGFGLATASVASHYQFGGVADLLSLEPTAGREAITTDGVQFLQSLITEVDAFVSERLAVTPEADSSTPFMNWVLAHGRYDLCRNLRIMIYPGDRIPLGEVERLTADLAMHQYAGADQNVITRNATDEMPLLVLARHYPRRNCEASFLAQYCRTVEISDNPIVEHVKSYEELSTAESALSFRVETVLDSDYFVKARVRYGRISHGLPILVENVPEGIIVTLDPNGTTVSLILGLYDREYSAFPSMVKDFIRTMIFPRISEYVPSSTRQGAEAFLQSIRRSRHTFEYEDSDLGSLPKIWESYLTGQLSMSAAIESSLIAARSTVQVVDSQASAHFRDVMPDVIVNEQAMHQAIEEQAGQDLGAVPAITRTDREATAKILIISPSEPALRGYRCFLAITDQVREEYGDFFLQPHKTSIVWGGQKVVFIFPHHSEQFGLYYDLQTRDVIDAKAGGGSFPSCTIIMKNAIYIPIPELIQESFVPSPGERKRFEVRADVLRVENTI